MILSEQFPACGGAILEPEVRQLYLKGLEGADTYRRTAVAAGVAPRVGGAETQPELAELTPKSKAKPPPAEAALAEPIEPKQEEPPNYSPDKSPQEEEIEEEEPKGKEKKTKPVSSPERGKARSSGIRRRRMSEEDRRSRSRRRRRSRSRRGDPEQHLLKAKRGGRGPITDQSGETKDHHFQGGHR